MKKNYFLTALLLGISLCATSGCSPEMRENLQEKVQGKSAKQQTPKPQKPTLLPFSETLAQEIEQNRQFVESQIVEKDGKTMYFFDKSNADNKNPRIEQKTAGGFYRVILGKTAAGHCAVQDFYADTDQKQCEPLIVSAKNCDNFNTTGYDGSWIAYDENQQTFGIAHLKDGKLLSYQLTDNKTNAVLDFANEPKTSLTFEFPDKGIAIFEWDNQVLTRHTTFIADKTIQVNFANGQADFNNSHAWDDTGEFQMDKQQFEKAVANTADEVSLFSQMMQQLKQELQDKE